MDTDRCQLALLSLPHRVRCEHTYHTGGLIMAKSWAWTEADITALRELWASGKPASEIGLLLHYSANAVIGKAHRMDLDARPSPIKGRHDAAMLRERHERAVLLAERGYKPYQIQNATGVSFVTAQRIVRRTSPVAAADPPSPPPMPAPEPPPPVPVVGEPEFDPWEYVFVARPAVPGADSPCWLPGCVRAASSGDYCAAHAPRVRVA
jgi:GcrA cell cycle regulator